MPGWKRVFDVCGAVGGLLFFGPLMICVAGAILMDDGWPVLFRQARLGRGRRPFEIVKFRSMRHGRVTRVDRLLRATGLDELPQFLNILRGDLSAVGPRPVTEEDARRFGLTGPSSAARWRVKPVSPASASSPGDHHASKSLWTAVMRAGGLSPSIAASSRCPSWSTCSASRAPGVFCSGGEAGDDGRFYRRDRSSGES